jgi:IS605 OrfB family transposase
VDKLARSAVVGVEVLDGADILEIGHEKARRLWNFIRYCVRVYTQQYWRGKPRQILGLDKPRWPGKYGLDKAFRGDPLGKALSDRCFSAIIREYDAAYRAFMSNKHQGRRARKPRYCEKPRPLFFEVGRNAKPVGNWMYRLTVLGGHVAERHAIIKIHIRPGIKMRDVKIIRAQPDGTGRVVFYREPSEATGQHIAAVDVGILNLACVVFDDGDSILYSGRGILASDQWYQKKAAKCKPSGWEGKGHKRSKASARLTAYRVKAGNTRRLAIHNLTRSIINECVGREVGTLIVGKLKGIREGADHGKVGNLKLHAWPFEEIRRQLEYKGEEVGIEVVTISEAYTSQTCHFCGTIDKASRVKRGLYRCRHCGVVVNADLNGAANILKKYRPDFGLGVEADFPGLPSLAEVTPGIGEASQIQPQIIAKFDLRNWSIVTQSSCTRAGGMQTVAH